MNRYVFYNPNPRGIKVGDCVIRGLTKLLGKTWDEVYTDVMVKGFEMKDMPSSNNVWGAYLRSKGFNRFAIPNTCPDCYTVRQFCADNDRGLFLLATGAHVVAVENGRYFDAWDSGDEVPIYYWRKEK